MSTRPCIWYSAAYRARAAGGATAQKILEAWQWSLRRTAAAPWCTLRGCLPAPPRLRLVSRTMQARRHGGGPSACCIAARSALTCNVAAVLGVAAVCLHTIRLSIVSSWALCDWVGVGATTVQLRIQIQLRGLRDSISCVPCHLSRPNQCRVAPRLLPHQSECAFLTGTQ